MNLENAKQGGGQEPAIAVAAVGEELEMFELEGRRYLKIAGSVPSQLRRLVVDRNIDIRLSNGETYSLIGGHPGLMVRVAPERRESAQCADFREVVMPGVRFKIVS